ncbi:hypothetical protein Tco_1418033 [Tanacetum coccineum]
MVVRKKVNSRYVVENVLIGCGGAYVGNEGDKRKGLCEEGFWLEEDFKDEKYEDGRDSVSGVGVAGCAIMRASFSASRISFRSRRKCVSATWVMGRSICAELRGTMAGVDVDTLTMEKYLALSRENQAPGVVKPEIEGNVNFESKSQFMRELREDTFF